MSNYRLAAVNYINTLPLLEGIKSHPVFEDVEIIPVVPAECAVMFRSGEVDISLVPVGALDSLENYTIISDYCIGSNGPVSTVCVYSEIPFHQLKYIVLDHHSMTSNLLVQVIAQMRNLSFQFIFPEENGQYTQNSGNLLIGDKTIGQDKKWAYTYDLGAAWKKLTGLPFTYAVWVASSKVPTSIIYSLNEAFKLGLNELEMVIRKYQALNPEIDLKNYFEKNIDYSFDELKKKALAYFLEQSKLVQSEKIH